MRSPVSLHDDPRTFGRWVFGQAVNQDPVMDRGRLPDVPDGWPTNGIDGKFYTFSTDRGVAWAEGVRHPNGLWFGRLLVLGCPVMPGGYESSRLLVNRFKQELTSAEHANRVGHLTVVPPEVWDELPGLIDHPGVGPQVRAVLRSMLQGRIGG